MSHVDAKTPQTRLVLVTDAGDGIGYEVASQLADLDFEVLLAAPAEDRARAATQRLWDHGLDSVHPRVLDPSSQASIERLRASVQREFGHLDVLVSGHAAVAGAFAPLLAPGGRVVEVDGDADAAVREISAAG